MDKPKLKLSGLDGNAFAILGRAKKEAKQAGWSKEQIDKYMTEAMDGDYDHLLQVTVNYFDVS